jgi:hypothetical protein
MPQPDYDPNEPDEVWDYVQETYSTPWSWGDFETPQLHAAIGVRRLPSASE